MTKVDIKPLLALLNGPCTSALQGAAGLCVSRTHYEVTVEHLLLKLTEDRSTDLSMILATFKVDLGRLQGALNEALEDLRVGNAGKPVFSPLLLDLFQDAWLAASVDLGLRRIRSGALLLAFLAKPVLYSTGRYADFLGEISREALAKDFFSILKGSLEHESPGALGGPVSGASAQGPTEGGFLKRYCQDFTEKARSGGIDPVFGRDHEIRQMVDILARRRKNNPICVGEPGVGKTAVVEGLALRITQGDVPDLLKDVSLLGLDMGLLEAGAGMKGEFENRLKGVIQEIKSSPKPIILFIDEAHTLIGAGGSAGGGDAANLLKPALARGELRTVAATTWSEYKKYFEKDPALARRFQLVKLEPPSVEDSVLILRGIRDSYEAAHKVVVRDDAIRAAAELSDKYITGRFLPDKAIDLLDTACARIKIQLATKPASLEDKERLIQALQRTQRALERDREHGVAIDEEALADTLARIESTQQEAELLKERWLKEKEAAEKVLSLREQLHALTPEAAEERERLISDRVQADRALAELQGGEPLLHLEVNPDVVAQVVSDWTGVPLGKMLRDEAEIILALADRLRERIKGQDHALEAMAEVIKSAKAGIKNPNQPIGVFLFVGPSGVGKTETAHQLADLLFGSEKSVVTINMSEFQESHTVSRLIGSPPGYVGYGEGGMLTEAVRQRPYSVVLLDEVEKAHLDVLNLFYQVFDKGMLTDGEGKEINFKNTILILTSNLATDVIMEMTASGDPIPAEAVGTAIRPILSKHFKPALLARMNVVPFFGLPSSALKGIVGLKLKGIQRTLKDNNKLDFTWTEAVEDAITARCTEVETGARNIEFILNGQVLPTLSQKILAAMGEGGMPSKVLLGMDESGQFSFVFEEK